jgi:hypothetical protein
MTMMGLRIRRSQIPSDHLKGVAAENQWGYIYMYLKRVCVCVYYMHFPIGGLLLRLIPFNLRYSQVAR